MTTNMPLRQKLITLLQVLFSMPGEILEEVIDENNREDQEFLERLRQNATGQPANHETA